MAKSNKGATTDATEESLADFSFDDNEEFFGIKKGTLGDDEVRTTASKLNQTGHLDFDDNDEGSSTDLETVKDTKPKEKPQLPTNKVVKKPATTKKGEEDEDENEEDEDFSFDNKPKAKPKEGKEGKVNRLAEKKEDEEDEDDEIDEDEETKTKPKATKAKSKDTEEDDEEGEDNPDDDDENDEDIEEKELEVYTELAKEFKDEGFFSSVKLPKGEKIPRDKFYEFVNEEIEARKDEDIAEIFKNIDEDGKAFLKFKRDGGATHVFFSQYGSTLGIEEFDETKPEHVNKVIRHYLTTRENLEDEEFEDRIKYIKDSGKEQATAKRWYATIKKDDDDRKKAVVEMQAKQAEQKKENAKAFNLALKETLENTDKIGVFTISKKEAKELETFIDKATVKAAKGYIPEIHAELNRILTGRTKEDRKDLIILAKLIKDKFKLPDDIVTDVQTKVTKKVRSRLAHVKANPRISSGGGGGKKSLADFID